MRSRPAAAQPRVRLLPAAVVLGVGIGAFFDGIVLHQILQWHHMLSSPSPPVTVDSLQLNTLGDGLFHAAAWVFTVAGAFLLLRADRAPAEAPVVRRFVGGLAIGWGLFNMVEGIVDHHLLGIHHVRAGPDELVYDLGFLAWGAAMVALGWALARRSGTPLERS